MPFFSQGVVMWGSSCPHQVLDRENGMQRRLNRGGGHKSAYLKTRLPVMACTTSPSCTVFRFRSFWASFHDCSARASRNRPGRNDSNQHEEHSEGEGLSVVACPVWPFVHLLCLLLPQLVCE